MQCIAIGGAFLLAFFVLFATRDVILRSDSFLFQAFCILLVALLPGIGFLLYILIRPPATLRQRRLERTVGEILARLHSRKQEQVKQAKNGKQETKSKK